MDSMNIFDSIDDETIEEDYAVLNYLNPDRRQRVVRERPDNMSEWDDKKFHRRFRLEKSTVQFLLSLIGSKIANTTNRNESVPALQQILLTLRFYACGSFYITIGDFAGIHNSTVCKIIKKVTEAIASLRQEFVTLPANREEILSVQEGFYNIARFPRVIAALDCTHIKIISPERFCDVTLYCSPSFATQVAGKDTVEPQNIRGVSLRAHRVVLAACSELLGALLGAHEAQGEPVLVIDGAEPRHLKALLDYMYTGEMNVHHSQLASLLKTAEELRIKGLTDIRWNNKDEPPDSEAGIVTTATATTTDPKPLEKHTEAKQAPKHSPKHTDIEPEPRQVKKDDGDDGEPKHCEREKFNVNGGPPPLIKLPIKEKTSPIKRETSDSDSPSPKRQRLTSGTEHTDDETLNPMPSIIKSESIQDWQHGNLRVYEPQDITAERVVGWGMRSASRSTSRDPSDDEWADAPTDIGSFLHTKLRVDGDNSADEESNESVPTRQSAAASSSSSAATSSISTAELRVELAKAQLSQITLRPPTGPKSGQADPRFLDVVKLSDYLQHGRRPQFWEENYVRRVMEAVRLKELEMKQAAEILGVSYGTLYGRYRDVYGCINRPYRVVNGTPSTLLTPRAVRDFWQAKGPSEVLDRLQRGEMSLDSAAQALGVSINNLAAHLADFGVPEKEFEPIPIEMDPSLKVRSRTYSAGAAKCPVRKPVPSTGDKPPIKKILIGTVTDEEPIPATVIATAHDSKPPATPPNTTGKWPSIRVASLDSLRGGSPPSLAPPASPSALMRTRPDLTIVAARRPDKPDDDVTT